MTCSSVIRKSATLKVQHRGSCAVQHPLIVLSKNSDIDRDAIAKGIINGVVAYDIHLLHLQDPFEREGALSSRRRHIQCEGRKEPLAEPALLMRQPISTASFRVLDRRSFSQKFLKTRTTVGESRQPGPSRRNRLGWLGDSAASGVSSLPLWLSSRDHPLAVRMTYHFG